jgi:hypothetical protein
MHFGISHGDDGFSTAWAKFHLIGISAFLYNSKRHCSPSLLFASLGIVCKA